MSNHTETNIEDVTNKQSEHQSIQLFITVGKGLEDISQDEIIEKTAKFNTKIRNVTTGKVFFEANTSHVAELLDSLNNLKTVERVFAVVGVLKTPKMISDYSSNYHKQTVDFEKNLKEQICNIPNWANAKSIWQHGVKDSSNTSTLDERPPKRLKVDGNDETTSAPSETEPLPSSDVRFRISCKSSRSLRHVNPQVCFCYFVHNMKVAW